MAPALSRIAGSLSPRELPHAFIPQITDDKKRRVFEHRVERKSHPDNIFVETRGGAALALFLDWDTRFFSKRFFRVEALAVADKTAAGETLNELERQLVQKRADYAFAIVNDRSAIALDALRAVGWEKIETRVTYWLDGLKRFSPRRRFSVKVAGASDAVPLGEVAVQAKNKYDRFRADSFFSPKQADDLMREWVRASTVGGFADRVLAPSTGNSAFMTMNFLKDEWPITGVAVSQLVFSAVNPGAAGWYPKLVSEGLANLKDAGAEIAVMTTQVENKAVTRTWESLGLILGETCAVMRKVF